MESLNRHPLESITKREDLSMLELLIPFVDYPLKLPLALFIKLNEILLIVNAFRSSDTIERLGLHSASRDPMQIIGSLTGISPEMLQLLFSFANTAMDSDSFSPEVWSALSGNSTLNVSELANLFHQSVSFPDNPAFKKQTETTNTNTANETGLSSTLDSISDPDISDPQQKNANFESNIQKILADYDMQQAKQFAEETEKLHPY